MSTASPAPAAKAVPFPKVDVEFIKLLVAAADYEISRNQFEQKAKDAEEAIDEYQNNTDGLEAINNSLRERNLDDLWNTIEENEEQLQAARSSHGEARIQEQHCLAYLPRLVQGQQRIWRQIYSKAELFIRNRMKSPLADSVHIQDRDQFCLALAILLRCKDDLESAERELSADRRAAIDSSDAVRVASQRLQDAKASWFCRRSRRAEARAAVAARQADRKEVHDIWQRRERVVTSRKKALRSRENFFVDNSVRPLLEAAGRLPQPNPPSPGIADMTFYIKRRRRWLNPAGSPRKAVFSAERQNWLAQRANVARVRKRLETKRLTYSRSLAAHLTAYKTSTQAAFDRKFTRLNRSVPFHDEEATLLDELENAEDVYEAVKEKAKATGEQDLPLSPDIFADQSDDENPGEARSGGESEDRSDILPRGRIRRWGRGVARAGSPVDPQREVADHGSSPSSSSNSSSSDDDYSSGTESTVSSSTHERKGRWIAWKRSMEIDA